jgi:hypothetical protein
MQDRSTMTSHAPNHADPTATGIHRSRAQVRRRALALCLAVTAATAVGGVTLADGQGRPVDNPAFTGAPVLTREDAIDRANVVQTVDALFVQFDAENWPAVGALLADRIDVDFSSLGGVRSRLTREELIRGWRTSFAGPKSSGHSITNHQVRLDGDRAEVFAHGYAYNALDRRFGGSVWETWGTYRFALRRVDRGRWVITAEQYTSLRVAGNEGVRDAVAESPSLIGPIHAPDRRPGS